MEKAREARIFGGGFAVVLGLGLAIGVGIDALNFTKLAKPSTATVQESTFSLRGYCTIIADVDFIPDGIRFRGLQNIRLSTFYYAPPPGTKLKVLVAEVDEGEPVRLPAWYG